MIGHYFKDWYVLLQFLYTKLNQCKQMKKYEMLW